MAKNGSIENVDINLKGEELRQLVGFIGINSGIAPENSAAIIDWILDTLEHPEQIVPYSIICSYLTEIAWQKRIHNSTQSASGGH